MDRVALFVLPNVVLFPGMVMGLHIFEPRYRAMMEDHLAHGKAFGIILGRLLQHETPELTPYEVGTTVQLLHTERLDDGKFDLVAQGDRRFVVEETDHTAPYLQGRVRWLEETEDGASLTSKTPLVKQTRQLFFDAMRLSCKIQQASFKEPEFPDEPERLSYFIAENLKGSLVRKQELLSLDSTRERLRREKALLADVVKTLAVQAQIEDAFR